MPHALIGAFVGLLGLCIGSFLNVVIYRLPRDLSIHKPSRSFCPNCRRPIAAFDNIPLLSWLLLGGRCRHCRTPISVQYPLVEALTGLSFVLTYHLLVVARARVGSATLDENAINVLLVAWLTLNAALVACSAMDLVSYTVDTRITNLAMLVGLVVHALLPARDFFLPRAGTPLAAAAVAALLVCGVVFWLARQRHRPRVAGPAEQEKDAIVAPPTTQPPATQSLAIVVGAWSLIALAVGVGVWLLALSTAPAAAALAQQQWPIGLGLLMFFVATVLVSGQSREADQELEEALVDEAPHARKTALRELLVLLPGLGAAAAMLYVFSSSPAARSAWHAACAWPAGGTLAPLGGLVFAVHGLIVAAAAGWLLRIVFTLAFGREAFGVGDIYILAAAGACGGWDIALLGLLLSVGLAMAGLVVGMLLKRAIMIPFGPWLALGFLCALWTNVAAARQAEEYYLNIAATWEQRPDLLLLTGGVLIVAAVGSVFLAKLVRRAIERE